MNIVRHPSNNFVFNPPRNWDHSQVPCGHLPVTVGTLAGTTVEGLASFWRPTPEELQSLVDGGTIALAVVGHSLPPLQLQVIAVGNDDMVAGAVIRPLDGMPPLASLVGPTTSATAEGLTP